MLDEVGVLALENFRTEVSEALRSKFSEVQEQQVQIQRVSKALLDARMAGENVAGQGVVPHIDDTAAWEELLGEMRTAHGGNSAQRVSSDEMATRPVLAKHPEGGDIPSTTASATPAATSVLADDLPVSQVSSAWRVGNDALRTEDDDTSPKVTTRLLSSYETSAPRPQGADSRVATLAMIKARIAALTPSVQEREEEALKLQDRVNALKQELRQRSGAANSTWRNGRVAEQ